MLNKVTEVYYVDISDTLTKLIQKCKNEQASFIIILVTFLSKKGKCFAIDLMVRALFFSFLV